MTKRRDFIKKSVLGTAGLTIGGMGFSSRSYSSIIGANDRLNIAVIGIRSRGVEHIESWCSLKDSHNVRLVTLCDADESFFAERSKTVADKTGFKPSTEWDMRKVFENREIHAVSFATPNHWHALGSIWAAQAGKHVYVEKPCNHNIFEGRRMIEASRKYNVRIQVGFQNRSVNNIIEAMKFLHGGGIGEVYMARGLCYKPRDSFGIANDSEPPASLHYDLWLGPAPWRPYNEKRSHYNWHWFWDTGNGDTGKKGPHQFDFARWGLNKNEHPVSVHAGGGIFGIDPKECAQQTPNTLSCTFKYSDGKMLEFETRGRYTNNETDADISIGNMFYGTEGYLELKGESGRPWKAFRKRETVPFAGSDETAAGKNQDTLSGSGGEGHFANFIDAIRSGKNETLNCDIQEGHLSCVLPHLANISHRLGRGLKFDGSTEKFINDAEADAMITQQYRKPYVVPEKFKPEEYLKRYEANIFTSDSIHTASFQGCARTGPKQAIRTPSFIIDSHMHYTATDEWEKSFLEIYTRHNAMACVLMPMKDLDRGIAFAKAHPDRVIPYAEIDIDSPTVAEDIQKVHSMGFKGLGELFAKGRRDYNDPLYDTIWALAQKLEMPVAPHTGILFDGSMSHMRPAFLADIAARYPKLIIHSAHFGNPWYEEAAEATRRNRNLYFDLSGSSLIKKENDPGYWAQWLWWSDAIGKAHTPADAVTPWEKILFATDEGPEALEENIRRFNKALDACNVSAETRAKCYGLTIAKIYGINPVEGK